VSGPVRLELDVKEVDFIVALLTQVPTGNTLQAGMFGLVPKILQQANSKNPDAASDQG
jgi:hypothetical protein